MSNLYVRAFYERKAETEEAEGGPMRFTASTEGVARDGMVISAEGWKLENYRKNPVVLWAHDYLGRTLPIGRAVNVAVEGKALVADVVFDPADDFARQVERKYRTGFLNAVSVGWETKLIEPSKNGQSARVAEAELLDISAVPVPGDPDALMEREYRGLREIYETTNNTNNTNLDNSPGQDGAEGEWEELRAEMASLFVPAPDESDEERKRRYQALLPKYRRLGKTPPEFRTVEELEALTAEEVAGLFLEGEILTTNNTNNTNQRVGAVLNARNRGELEQAVALIQGVLARAVKEVEDQEAETEERAEPEPSDPDETESVLLALRARLISQTFTNFSGGLK